MCAAALKRATLWIDSPGPLGLHHHQCRRVPVAQLQVAQAFQHQSLPRLGRANFNFELPTRVFRARPRRPRPYQGDQPRRTPQRRCAGRKFRPSRLHRLRHHPCGIRVKFLMAGVRECKLGLAATLAFPPCFPRKPRCGRIKSSTSTSEAMATFGQEERGQHGSADPLRSRMQSPLPNLKVPESIRI